MNLRSLIREEVARNIPFEHNVMIRRDTQHKSRFHLGGSAMNAKEMGIENKTPVIRPVVNEPRVPQRQRTERQKDYERFMEDKRFGAGGALERAKVEPAPRFDVLMCAWVLKNVNPKKIFEDLNGNFVVHTDKSGDPDNFWIKPWSEARMTPTQEKMNEALKQVNDTFGTAYFIDITYPKNGEEIFVIKSGEREEASKKPVTYGQYLNFSEVIEKNERLLRAMEAMNGLDHMMSDKTPWRLMTEPIKPQQARVGIIGTSARNG